MCSSGRGFLRQGAGPFWRQGQAGVFFTPHIEHPYIFGVDARFKSGLDMVWIPALFQYVMGKMSFCEFSESNPGLTK